jgi:hypothetical protein
MTGLPLRGDAQQGLVQGFAVGAAADRRVGGRGVEADDDQRQCSATTLKTKEPTRLFATNQLTLCLPTTFEVMLFT